MIPGRAAMNTRHASMNVAAADSCRRSSPLCGSLPFSGANAAVNYLPLQLALRPEVKSRFVREKLDFTDE